MSTLPTALRWLDEEVADVDWYGDNPTAIKWGHLEPALFARMVNMELLGNEANLDVLIPQVELTVAAYCPQCGPDGGGLLGWQPPDGVVSPVALIAAEHDSRVWRAVEDAPSPEPGAVQDFIDQQMAGHTIYGPFSVTVLPLEPHIERIVRP